MQTGPHSLDALLQLGLKPHDLIWVEGQSAGWSYPSEIAVLKPHVAPEDGAPAEKEIRTAAPQAPAQTKTDINQQRHIYVSLPANRAAAQPEEAPTAASLEEKAAALYQRVQAFAEGQEKAETDTRYTRSLDDMKQEYGTWLVQQKKKKKQGTLKKKVLIAASVLVITTTGYSVNKWISQKSGVKETPLGSYTPQPSTANKKQPTSVAFNLGADTSTTHTNTEALQKAPVVIGAAVQKNIIKQAATIKRTNALKHTDSLLTDTATHAIVPTRVVENPAPQETKKVIVLSRLVVVNGNLQYDKKGNTITGAQVTLQNNSSELLKSVAVTVTYFKKEDRQLNKETVNFYNVQPGSAPVLNTSGNRRATTAHFEIGTIVRADGSLYLIH